MRYSFYFYSLLLGLCLSGIACQSESGEQAATEAMAEAVPMEEETIEMSVEEVAPPAPAEPEESNPDPFLDQLTMVLDETEALTATESSLQMLSVRFDGYESGGEKTFWFNEVLELIYFSESWGAEAYSGETTAVFEGGKLVAAKMMESDESDDGESMTAYLADFAPDCGRSWRGYEPEGSEISIEDCSTGERLHENLLTQLAESKEAIQTYVSAQPEGNWRKELEIILTDTISMGEGFEFEQQQGFRFTEGLIPWFQP